MLGVTLNVLNQKGAPALYEDIAANRPAAGFTGRLFVSTDTLLLQRDTGITWQTIAGGGSSIGGSISSGQVAYGSGVNTINGSNNLFWDATNNNLGVGTNSPTSLFGRSIHLYNAGSSGTVADNASFVAQSVNRNANYYSWIPSTGSAGYQVQGTGGTPTYGSFTIQYAAGGVYNNRLTLNVNGNQALFSDENGNTTLYAYSAGSLILANQTGVIKVNTNGTTKMQVSNAGEIGIGVAPVTGVILSVVGLGTISSSKNIPSTGVIQYSTIGNYTDIGTSLTGGVSVAGSFNQLNYISTGSRTIAATNVYASALNVLSINVTNSSAITITQSGSNIRAMYANFSQVNISTFGTNSSSISHVAAIATQLYSDTVHQLTIGTYYGVLVTDSTQFYSGNVTNRWALYQEGATDINFLNGELRMGIGQTVSASVLNTVTNKVKLIINGTTYYLLASTSGV